jgi:Sulfotransferase family
LRPHTLLPSPSKETRFFDTHFHRGLNWYGAHYRDSGGRRRRGEVAPTYFASAAARERMAEVVPEAKIVCVFRNPVDRIVSLYRLKRAYGLIPWGFEEAIERDPELVDSSRYASTLRLWQRSFGVEKVLAGVYDDLRHNPQAFVDSLVDFIGVPRFRLAEWQSGRVHDSENHDAPAELLRDAERDAAGGVVQGAEAGSCGPRL